MPRLSVGGRVYDSRPRASRRRRPKAGPCPRTSRRRPCRRVPRPLRRRARASPGRGRPRQEQRRDRCHDLAGQLHGPGEARSVWPEPAGHRNDERERDQEVEREQHRSRRQGDDRCAMAGTATVCAGDERIRRETEEREAGKSCQLPADAARANIASSPAAAATTARGSTAASIPRAAPVNRVTGPVRDGTAGGAVGVGAVVTATGHTVGLHRP